jgi:hypothetical protein
MLAVVLTREQQEEGDAGQFLDGEVVMASQVGQDVLARLGAVARDQLSEVRRQFGERGDLLLERQFPRMSSPRHRLRLATVLLSDDAEEPTIRAGIHDVLGYLADDLREARTHRVATRHAATGAGYAYLTAQSIVGIADLADRLGLYEQAARLLAAGAGVRGLPDRSRPDEARIERDARRHLGEARFAEVTREGTQASRSELVEVTPAP